LGFLPRISGEIIKPKTQKMKGEKWGEREIMQEGCSTDRLVTASNFSLMLKLTLFLIFHQNSTKLKLQY